VRVLGVWLVGLGITLLVMCVFPIAAARHDTTPTAPGRIKRQDAFRHRGRPAPLSTARTTRRSAR